MGAFFSKPQSKLAASALPDPNASIPGLNNDLALIILEFCDDTTLLATSETSTLLYAQSHYVLQQRLKQELALFGVTATQANLGKLTVAQLYQLRRCLMAMEHHDTFDAQALKSKAQDIKALLEIAVPNEGGQNLAHYLYSIFSALASATVPIIERLPGYLAVLNEKSTKFTQRLQAIYEYAQGDAKCVALFETLAVKHDPVAHWYLYQIYRLGLCAQAANPDLAAEHLTHVSRECVRFPELIAAYKTIQSTLCMRALNPSSLPLTKADQAVLSLPKQLSAGEKLQFDHAVTRHQLKK